MDTLTIEFSEVSEDRRECVDAVVDCSEFNDFRSVSISLPGERKEKENLEIISTVALIHC